MPVCSRILQILSQNQAPPWTDCMSLGELVNLPGFPEQQWGSRRELKTARRIKGGEVTARASVPTPRDTLSEKCHFAQRCASLCHSFESSLPGIFQQHLPEWTGQGLFSSKCISQDALELDAAGPVPSLCRGEAVTPGAPETLAGKSLMVKPGWRVLGRVGRGRYPSPGSILSKCSWLLLPLA